MGMVSKALTKRKVAPDSAPDNIVADSQIERALHGARRVRNAALSESLDGVASQTGRGRVSVFAFGTESQLWYRWHADNEWSVTLGALAGGANPTEDWVLRARIPSLDSNTRVEVSTPAYLTVDGSLANPALYDATRTRLLDAFAYEDRGDDAEVRLSEASLQSAPARGVRSTGKPNGRVAVRITADTADLHHALAQIALPCDADPSSFRWRTVLGDPFLHLTLQVADGPTMVLEGAVELPQSTDPYRTACAEAAATTWYGRARAFFEDLDEDFELTWPDPS